MSQYKDKIRVRSCGILVKSNSLLLVKLLSPITNKIIWTPPGGGVEFGETLKDAVKREFFEEAGINVSVGEIFYTNEIIKSRYHSIEHYFLVRWISGKVKKGSDPELSNEKQIIKEIGFKTQEELKNLNVSPAYFKDQFWLDN